MAANILPTDPHPLTLWLESKCQYTTFSEHGHGAYQFKGNHKCSNIVSNILLGSIGQKSTFSEHDHVAYLNKGNHEMQQHGHTMVEIVRISLVYFFY